MSGLHDADISCPYCGETISVLLDSSIEQQTYIEDCQVCCRPIVFKVDSPPDQDPKVEVRTEDDAY